MKPLLKNAGQPIDAHAIVTGLVTREA